MKLTVQQLQELGQLAKPIVDFLKEHGDPHASVVITTQLVQAHEGVASIPVSRIP